MKTYTRKCYVPQCKAKEAEKEILFTFPKDQNIAKQWAQILNIRNVRNALVCSSHFKLDDFIGTKSTQKMKKQLKKKAIPSQNIPQNKQKTKFLMRQCSVRLSPLPIFKVPIGYQPYKITENSITKTKILKKVGNINKNEMKPLSDKNLEILVNSQNGNESKGIDITISKEDLLTLEKNFVRYQKNLSPKSNKTPVQTEQIIEKPSKKDTTTTTNILKNTNRNSPKKPIKQKFVTKLGQFKPRRRNVTKGLTTLDKKIVKYEVVEQKNDCNILILKI